MPATKPMMNAPNGETASQPAVMATRPAREPFRVMETSGLPYRFQVKIMVTQVATAAARLVLKQTRPVRVMVSSVDRLREEPPLKPNQQNQRMNTPRAPAVRLWPGMA